LWRINVGNLNDKESFIVEQAPHFAKTFSRIMEMLKNIVEGNNIEMISGQLRIRQSTLKYV